MKKIKSLVARIIWKIAGISPKAGNAVMDILGDENYVKVMNHQKQ